MQMLQSISKSLAALVVGVVLGGCHSNAQTAQSADPLSEYHGLYTPSNTEAFQASMHTNHPDYDWGVWGHNLAKLVKDGATDDMYAIVDGKRSHKQFCFSSQSLYNKVREYVLDQYGWGTADYSERISIMPMDNKTACTCDDCTARGNTSTNATPAVTAFVERLAEEFPRHKFFTSAYHTTNTPPTTSLAANVGTFVSSIKLPMRVDFTKTEGYNEFVHNVKAWRKQCSRIYVWDYERNYDDYLSPFPCLLAMQARFRLYRDLGVQGVFVNGSGDDYSAFDDMQTYVLALLLDNPDTDVHESIARYYREHYPQTADLLTTYYWGLEQRAQSTNHLLPLYGSMQEMCESYLDVQEFVSFRSQLDKASKLTVGDERKRLNALLTALAYTQLEMYRTGLLAKDAETIGEMREILKGHSELKGMNNRDESGHSIDDYLKKWE